MSTLLPLEPLIGDINQATWDVFDEMASNGAAVDMQKWTTYFAFDVVGTLGLGGPLGFVRNRRDTEGIIKSIHGMFYVSSVMGYIPGQLFWLRNSVSQALFRLMGDTSASAGLKFQQWLYGQCKARMDKPEVDNRRRDMLDHFISMKEPNGQPVQIPGVMIEGGNLIGAGADTTSAGISSVIGELVTHPADYRRVQMEVDEACRKMADQTGSGLDYRTAEKLPFLSACIKEALRLTPSIVWQLPRHAPVEGMTIAGYNIPRGTTLSMSPYAFNRSKTIFGSDAEQWRPERYLAGHAGVTEENVREMDKFNTTVSQSTPLAHTELF